MSQDFVTTEERYLSATQSSDLRVTSDKRCDADRLLAAAYAVSGDPRRKLALRVYRLRATGDMSGAKQVAEDLGAMARGKLFGSKSGGYLRGVRADIFSRVQAADIAMTVIKWWSRPTCPTCKGREHPLIANTPMLDTSRYCMPCGGTGRVKLERLVRTDHIEMARWIAAEIDGLSSLIFSDMSKKLKSGLDL